MRDIDVIWTQYGHERIRNFRDMEQAQEFAKAKEDRFGVTPEIVEYRTREQGAFA